MTPQLPGQGATDVSWPATLAQIGLRRPWRGLVVPRTTHAQSPSHCGQPRNVGRHQHQSGAVDPRARLGSNGTNTLNRLWARRGSNPRPLVC